MKNKKVTKFVTPLFETGNDITADWFGYYNYDTLNYNQTKMLCNRSSVDNCMVESGMVIELGYYDIPEGAWHHIGWSDSWNWQQGAMLQWLPGAGNENKVIYNFSKDNHFKSCIYDIVTCEENIIDFPIYGITPDGKKAITLNYERSYWCRAYHYQTVVNPKYDVSVATDDGIFEVDLKKNVVRRIINIYDVIGIDANLDFSDAKHWFEHIMISPDGSRFAFLHRFTLGEGYTTRLCIANIDGSGLQVIGGWRQFEWSHFGWKGSDEFVIYTVEKTKLAKTVATVKSTSLKRRKSLKFRVMTVGKKMIPLKFRRRLSNRNYYQHYKLDGGRFTIFDSYGGPILRIDGHPSFTKDGRYMLTDSYPYEDGFQHLIIMDTYTRKACIVAQLYASLKETPASCDLHPKLSRNENYVVVDTAYTGQHRMICFKINWELVKMQISK